MPITPFNNLRNPYSVNQPTDNVGGTTGTGRAIIVRFQGFTSKQWTGISPNAIGSQWINPTNTVAGIPVQDWYMSDGNCVMGAQPGDPSYTTFISQVDYQNTDMNNIAASPLMWEVGQNITYWYETAADNALDRDLNLMWEIIEVIDEATYAGGAGIPTAFGITQATYGTIPVGVLGATPGDINCNGCTTAYKDIFALATVAAQQFNGLPENITPGYIMSDPVPSVGVITANQLSPANPLMMNTGWPNVWPNGSGTYNYGGLHNYSGGFYIGTYWGICNTQIACRNPAAYNYDNSTTPYWAEWLLVDPGNVAVVNFATFQVDCAYVEYTPVWPPSGTDFGDESCCIFADPNPVGCLPPDQGVVCGCMGDAMAANFCATCTAGCDGVDPIDTSCCVHFHEWKYCGGGWFSSACSY